MTNVRKITLGMLALFIGSLQVPKEAHAEATCPWHIYMWDGPCQYDCYFSATSPQPDHGWYSCSYSYGAPPPECRYSWVTELDCRYL